MTVNKHSLDCHNAGMLDSEIKYYAGLMSEMLHIKIILKSDTRNLISRH